MTKKTGLGKGLDALFSVNVPEEEQVRENEIVKSLKITDIEPNPEQARRIFDEETLEELSESIKRYGVIQPIIVTKKDNYYQIIAGERRWRASKKAGIKVIPAIIRDDDEKKNREISLIENIQREDLNPIEKARGLKTLLSEYGMTQQELADTIGKSRSSIANSVRILNLDDRVIDLALEGKLTEAHCKALMSIDDKDKQYEMALQVIESGDPVKAIEKKLAVRKKAAVSEEKLRKYEQYQAIYRDIENSFRGFFGTKVKVDAKRNKGKIIIEYASNDDLTRILDLIK